jgi:hypothetical protein
MSSVGILSELHNHEICGGNSKFREFLYALFAHERTAVKT